MTGNEKGWLFRLESYKVRRGWETGTINIWVYRIYGKIVASNLFLNFYDIS